MTEAAQKHCEDMDAEKQDRTASAQPKQPAARADLFRDAIWLLTQSPEYKYMFLADLDWAILPPYLLSQYRMFYKDNTPMAIVCWATVNDEVLARLRKLGTRIRPREWNCGEHVIIMAVVAPFGGGEQVLEEMRRTVFAGKEVHMLRDVASGGVGT